MGTDASSGRYRTRATTCQSGQPSPFFIVFDPFMPHQGWDTVPICAKFDRGECLGSCTRKIGSPPATYQLQIKPCDPASEGKCACPAVEQVAGNCKLDDNHTWTGFCDDGTGANQYYKTRSAYCRQSGDVFQDTPVRFPGQNAWGSCTNFPDYMFKIAQNLDFVDSDTIAPFLEKIYFANMSNPDSQQARTKYLAFINVFDRTVDEILAYLKNEGLMSTTAILYTTDNGFHLTMSKDEFSEHGYRTPIVVYDPAANPGLAQSGTDDQCGATGAQEPLAGCRHEFAHTVDLLATIKDFAGCSTPLSSCEDNPQPPPTRDPNAAYAEGRNLRSTNLGLERPCPNPPVGFGQCLYGMQNGSQDLSLRRRGTCSRRSRPAARSVSASSISSATLPPRS